MFNKSKTFRAPSVYWTDGYKVGHKRMMPKNISRLYGTWIPRTFKRAHGFIAKALSFGHQLSVRWLASEYQENFFDLPFKEAEKFVKDISMYLGQPYDGDHFYALHKLGYLPIKIKALPEGIETGPNIPHMTFINTVDGFAWLTLFLETIISALAWKSTTSATTAMAYIRNTHDAVMDTDPEMAGLIPYLCHDFSARGLDPFSMYASGLGHSAAGHRGSDTVVIIPASRFFYDEPEDEVCINSVNASEHSVSCTKIFTVGEKQMILDWLEEFPEGILSIVADTFDLWVLLTEYLRDPAVKEAIMARNGKTVFRPDSGDPADIICGLNIPVFSEWSDALLTGTRYFEWEGTTYEIDKSAVETYNLEFGEHHQFDSGISDFTSKVEFSSAERKGAIQILADIFGTDTTSTGYKRLNEKIGLIYGDSITLDRQIDIYTRLKDNGFSATCIALGIGSYTYQMVTRDTLGFAAKGAWFEVLTDSKRKGLNIYKDPSTGDGTKKSLKGMVAVFEDINNPGDYICKEECTSEEEATGQLRIIFEDGEFFNETTLGEVRLKTAKLLKETLIEA
jgi:nicotinamide phosphoribosyltransferase